jgi:acyl transferase domain-containing protein
MSMDPQQRLLLEVVYEALESAGISLQDINGTLTSVFCGSFTNDYNAMLTKDLESYPKVCKPIFILKNQNYLANIKVSSIMQLVLVPQFYPTEFRTFMIFMDQV